MTWLKLSDDFPEQCTKLSDAAFRTHVEGLAWCMRRETGGVLSTRDIRRSIETADPWDAIAELLEAGFWQREGDAYQIIHHMIYQPEPDVIQRRREKDAERQRKHRRKSLGLDVDDASRRDSHCDLRRDEMRDSGRDGTRRDGTPAKGGR